MKTSCPIESCLKVRGTLTHGGRGLLFVVMKGNEQRDEQRDELVWLS
jgi:hypothetical protein